jgi:hypothetical protein
MGSSLWIAEGYQKIPCPPGRASTSFSDMLSVGSTSNRLTPAQGPSQMCPRGWSKSYWQLWTQRDGGLVQHPRAGAVGRLPARFQRHARTCFVASPNLCCARTVPEPYLICPLGLAFERKQMPLVNENTENRTKGRKRWSGGMCLQSRCSPS